MLKSTQEQVFGVFLSKELAGTAQTNVTTELNSVKIMEEMD